MELPKQQLSLWQASARSPGYAPLQEDIEADVAIVGGGITGLNCAYLLKQSGLKVVVLEKNSIGSGTTGSTTGKVTSQHSLIYADLLERFGENTARQYGQANEAAIERMEQIINQENIECGWQRSDNYVYTVDPKRVSDFQAETKVAKSLGLPANFETETELPLPVVAAVKFANQAQVHSRQYILGLAKAVHGQGSFVFENSNVTRIRDGKPAAIEVRDRRVTTKDIIVASKVPAAPLLARGSYCALEYPHTSYIVAGDYKGDLSGMYISPDKSQYSILPAQVGDRKILLVGGQKHIPGLRRPAPCYHKLTKYAQENFGIENILYKWRAMDYLSYDSIPLIGKVYPWSKHLYTATGFKKWGLSTSMVAATILHDTILGQTNLWAVTFNSVRLRPVWSIPRAVFEYIKS